MLFRQFDWLLFRIQQQSPFSLLLCAQIIAIGLMARQATQLVHNFTHPIKRSTLTPFFAGLID